MYWSLVSNKASVKDKVMYVPVMQNVLMEGEALGKYSSLASADLGLIHNQRNDPVPETVPSYSRMKIM